MKCKDLVIFIINNNLLDEEIDDLKLSEAFLTLEQAAVKLGISTSSLRDIAESGMLDYIKYNDQLYFHENVSLTNLKRR